MAKSKDVDLDALIDEQFGGNIIDLTKEEGKVPYWLDSGVYSINYQISKNLRHGYPGGRVTQIVGLSGCLFDNTLIKINREKTTGYREYTIKEVYEFWDSSISTKTFSYNSERDEICYNEILEVIDSGNKECFELTTESGKSIIVSEEHPFLTKEKDSRGIKEKDGFVALKDLKIGEEIMIKSPEKVADDTLHSKESGHKSFGHNEYFYEKIKSIVSVGEKHTYDIRMREPHSNFIANDFVVHNTGKSMFASYAGKDEQVEKIFLIDSEGGGNGAELVDFLDIPRDKVKIFKAKTFENYRVNKSTMKIERVADKEVPAKLDTDTYIYYEGATRIVKKIIDTLVYNKIKTKILIIIDSVGNMKSVRELEGTQDMGAKAIALNSFFGYVNDIEKTSAALIFTNKMYQKLDGSFDPYVISGGESVIYNPSVTVRLATTAETDDMTDAEMKLEKEQRKSSLGASIKTLKAIVQKSRFGTEGRNAQFIIDFSSGPFRYSGLFKLLNDFGVIQKVGASARYVLPDIWGDTSFFKKDFIQMMMNEGEKGIDSLQQALTKAEGRIKEEKKKYQFSSDIQEVADEYEKDHEDVIYDNQELINAISQDEEDAIL